MLVLWKPWSQSKAIQDRCKTKNVTWGYSYFNQQDNNTLGNTKIITIINYNAYRVTIIFLRCPTLRSYLAHNPSDFVIAEGVPRELRTILRVHAWVTHGVSFSIFESMSYNIPTYTLHSNVDHGDTDCQSLVAMSVNLIFHSSSSTRCECYWS